MYEYKAHVTNVVDGDTFDCVIDLGFRVATHQRIRVDGIDTPESWRQGDIVYDITPSASGNIGWICTTAGSPGTWKTFGTIAA